MRIPLPTKEEYLAEQAEVYDYWVRELAREPDPVVKDMLAVVDNFEDQLFLKYFTK